MRKVNEYEQERNWKNVTWRVMVVFDLWNDLLTIIIIKWERCYQHRQTMEKQKYLTIEQVFASITKWGKLYDHMDGEIASTIVAVSLVAATFLRHPPSASPHPSRSIWCRCWRWRWHCRSYSNRLFSYVTLSPTSSMRWHFVIKFNSTCAPLQFSISRIRGMQIPPAIAHLRLNIFGCSITWMNVKLRAQLKLRDASTLAGLSDFHRFLHSLFSERKQWRKL